MPGIANVRSSMDVSRLPYGSVPLGISMKASRTSGPEAMISGGAKAIGKAGRRLVRAHQCRPFHIPDIIPAQAARHSGDKIQAVFIGRKEGVVIAKLLVNK